MITKKTYIPAKPRSNKLIVADKQKTFKNQIQNVEFELRKEIDDYQLNDNGLLDESEKINLKLLLNEVTAQHVRFNSEVSSILKSIYLADMHKDSLIDIALTVVGESGTIPTLVARINDILNGDGTIPADYKQRYEKALTAYFDSIEPLELAITGAKEAIEAEIKRRADSGAGNTSGGGKNELREYDLRFDGKYWNNVGFVEIEMDTIQIKKIEFLSDDQNSWTDENGNIIVL